MSWVPFAQCRLLVRTELLAFIRELGEPIMAESLEEFVTLHVEIGQEPVQPGGQPPGPVAEHAHHCGDEAESEGETPCGAEMVVTETILET